MVADGVDRARRDYAAALERGSLAETRAGIASMRGVIEPVIQAVAEHMVACEAQGRGRTPLLFQLCGAMDPAVLAYLTLRHAISEAGEGGCTLTSMAREVGRAVEIEGVVRSFNEADPAAVKVITQTLKRRGTGGSRAAVVLRANAKQRGHDQEPWAHRHILLVGLSLIDLMVGSTKLFELYQTRRGKRPVSMIRLSAAALAWLADHTHKAGLLAPAYLPMVETPVPWTGLRGGGYRGTLGSRSPLTKRSFKGQTEALAQAPLETVYAAVNAIQDTPWAVNQRVLKTMQQAWDTGRAFPGLVNKEDDELPPKPWTGTPSPDELRKWKYEARCVYEANAKAQAQRFTTSRLLSVASDLKDCPALYFPHQLDFRGRVYAKPVGLSPQGPDEARALLQFSVDTDANPEPDHGVRALDIHGANCFGIDKVSYTERLQWAQGNHIRILATAADPFADLWWTEADQPWTFLAYCFDRQRVVQGLTSTIPVSVDGSCNGLQHYAAMLRDPIAGAAVNLTGSATPQDIYREVAVRASSILHDRALEGDWIAQGWLDFGIDRKITKRQVMVLPYGGTHMSCIEYTREAVNEKIAGGKPNPFGDALGRAVVDLSGVIWEAIGHVVVSARAAMGWLQTLSRAYTAKGLSLSWSVPSGFVVHQGYMSQKQERINTIFGSLKRVRNYYYTDTDTLDGARQALAFPPNFVHSYDAAALSLTVAAAREEGLTHFACIHDSFGTRARDLDSLALTIRHQFVQMYENHDPLRELFDRATGLGITVDPPPQRGSLNLKEVYQSAYFFS